MHDVAGAQAKLHYRTTTDFTVFSAPRPLAHELHPDPSVRMVDAAVVWSPAGLLLGYKTGLPDGPEPQQFELARSTTGTLDGPWEPVGEPDISVFGNTIENYQFLHVQGRWQLLATTNSFDRPHVFTLRGNPSQSKGWLDWSKGRALDVPQERWNPGKGSTGVTFEHANCAFVVDGRKIGGHFYLVYSDAPDLTDFGGTGHGVLAIARSRDLVHWSVPPH